MARKPAKKPPANDASPASRRTKRNLPADERRRVLLDAATELFSERGMTITMQALADRVHVTQPLVHRYFPTKVDLINAVRDRIQNAHWDPHWREILTDRTRPLEERLQHFYSLYLPHIYRDTWYRAFWYVALHDPSFAQVYLGRVNSELMTAVIDEARFRFRYPSVETVPVFDREVEFVWGMHSTMIFGGIRRYVYHIDVWGDIETVVRDQIRSYLASVAAVMEELMPGAAAKRIAPAKMRQAG
jgi:AcrR family transcriptional regulator